MRSAKRQEKRRRILDAAREVCYREGIWNATTRRIAEQAGLPLATIHYHFESKDALLLEVFEELYREIDSDLKEAFPPQMSLAERVEQSILASWKYSEAHWHAQVLQSELTLYSVRTEGAVWLARRQYEGFVGLYARLYRAAPELTGHGDLDIERLARFVLAGIDGLLFQHYAEPDDERSHRGIRDLVAVSLNFPLTWGPGPQRTAANLRHPAFPAGREQGRE